MSNLESLIQKILEDARTQADEILQEADKIREKIINEKLNMAREEKARILDKAKKEALSMRNQIISGARLKARDNLLNAKQQLIDKVFILARERLMNISDEQYAEFVRNNVAALKLRGNEIIVVPENRKELIKSLGLDIKVSDDEAINSGFVIIDGNIRMNYTFDALMEICRENMESEIAYELFKSGYGE